MNRESLFSNYIRPLFPIFILLAIFWGLELIDMALPNAWSLDSYGIKPRDASSLPNIFLSPVLHGGFAHVAANSVPLSLIHI